MKFRRSPLLGAILIVAIAASPTVALTQPKDNAAIQFVSEEPLIQPEKTIRPLFIRQDKRLVEGNIRLLEDKIELTLPNAPVIELTRKLETAVSEDGKTIVQYGDEIDQSHPTRTNIYWKDSAGKPISQVVNYYAEEALVALSSNGLTAVAGRLFEDRSKTVLGLYSALGERLWEVTLRPDQRAAKVTLTNNGDHVVLATTDPQKWLTNHQLHLFDQSGFQTFSTGDFGVIQKIVATDDGDHVFVQGYDDYGVVRISSASIMWRNREKIRMTSPHGAAISPDGRTLFLSLADFRGKPQRLYRWRLTGVDIADGKEVFSIWLPGEFPGTKNRVFEQISADRIQIRTDSKRLLYSWKRSQEEN